MTTDTSGVRVAAGLLLSLTLVSYATAAARSAEAAPVLDTATTPEEAVHRLVQAQGTAYAGDCAGTRSPQDVGKVCAKLAAERPGMHAYLTGRTFSEFTQWVFVAAANGGWHVVGTTPVDFFAATPAVPWPR